LKFLESLKFPICPKSYPARTPDNKYVSDSLARNWLKDHRVRDPGFGSLAFRTDCLPAVGTIGQTLIQLDWNFLIFTSFVSPLEKLRKRSQGKENQKVIELPLFLLHKMGSIDPEPFDFQLFRFSFGETMEEVARNRKSKFIEQSLFLMHKMG
jgi:hypothetical protein